jgi:hypothetical protein
MMAAVLGYGSSATAAKPVPNDDVDATFVKGLACPDFTLHIVGSGGQLVSKQFVDKNGNPVRLLFAGTGLNFLYEALNEYGDVLGTFSTKSNGAVNQITYNTDGSLTYKVMGHNLLILFPGDVSLVPGDVPAGPSTTLIVGRLVFTVDTNNLFTVQDVSGKTTDICAVLSQ